MTKTQKTAFGERLSRALKARELGQRDLAERIGTTPQYISAIATGSKSVSPERIDSIARALDLDTEGCGSLHYAAATDLGFRLDLPPDFETPECEGSSEGQDEGQE